MVIGIIIMGGVMQVYLSTRDTQRTSEDQLTLLADTRFTLETIAYDLRHAGIWGRHNLWDMVACHRNSYFDCEDAPGSTYVLPPVTGDCANLDYINLQQPILAFDDNNDTYASTCATKGYVSDTDVVSVRYADARKIDTDKLAKKIVYLRTDEMFGQLFINDVLPDPIFSESASSNWFDDDVSSNHLMISRTYYLSDYTKTPGDGTPSLRRIELVQGPLFEDQMLISGVEDFQIEYGLDTGTNGVAGSPKDGQVNTYVNASHVTDWSNGSVIAAKIWVLMRTKRADRSDISGVQTFKIAGKDVTTADDGYRRFLLSTVVKIRNTTQLDK